MSTEKKPLNGYTIAGEKQTVSNLQTIRTQVLQDRTIFNMQAVGRSYKLAQAYKSVRNLRLMDPNKIQLKTFAEYVTINKKFLDLAPLIEEKPRPVYNANEAYLNTYTWLRFPKGKVLVLVHNDVYT